MSLSYDFLQYLLRHHLHVVTDLIAVALLAAATALTVHHRADPPRHAARQFFLRVRGRRLLLALLAAIGPDTHWRPLALVNWPRSI